jgi:putative protein kinase ArgK-like GTPase of G3E family
MEIPDVIVVNKADHPLAETMMREVRSVLSLGPQGDWKVPVVRTEAATGEGIADLLEQIDAHRRHIEETGSLAERRARNLRAEVLGIAAAKLRRRLEERQRWAAKRVDGDGQMATRVQAVHANYAQVRRALLRVERAEAVRLLEEGTISSDALHRFQRELDLEESQLTKE